MQQSATKDDLIVFAGVSKSYAKHQVLKQISFSIKQGEYLGLVGANGAGKTTLIKSLLDFIAIDSGAITISQVAQRAAASRALLAFVPEKFRPPFYLTGHDFLAFICQLHQVRYCKDEAAELCRQLDLDIAALDKRVGFYSKGMGQKLGLLAAFISHRPLLVLDEPMSGLDPKARIYLKQLLLKLRERGQTLFFSTHALADVETICDRMVILHQGEVRFWGTPKECCQKYATDSLEAAYLKCIE